MRINFQKNEFVYRIYINKYDDGNKLKKDVSFFHLLKENDNKLPKE